MVRYLYFPCSCDTYFTAANKKVSGYTIGTVLQPSTRATKILYKKQGGHFVKVYSLATMNFFCSPKIVHFFKYSSLKSPTKLYRLLETFAEFI